MDNYFCDSCGDTINGEPDNEHFVGSDPSERFRVIITYANLSGVSHDKSHLCNICKRKTLLELIDKLRYNISSKFLFLLHKQWNNLQTFKEQIDFLRQYKKWLMVYLDNDGEYVQFTNEALEIINDEELEFKFNNFKILEWFGNKDGVFELFNYLGVTVEGA